MNLKIKSILLALLTVTTFCTLLAQQKNIIGKVINEQGEAISGATVSSPEHTEVLTDQTGRFTIGTNTRSLSFKAPGYVPREVLMETLLINATVVLPEAPLYSSEEDMVKVPFNRIERRKITGSVNTIDVQRGLKKDMRTGINAAINGKVPGVFGGTNTWGTGNAKVIVDGIPRDTRYLDMMEVESITVLKDAASKALYGAYANQGIILIETKRGFKNKRDIRFNAEYGVSMPIEESVPSFLNAADYMETHSQARINDGLAPVYTQEVIDATRAGSDPARYPDVDYYGADFVKPLNNFVKLFGDIAGGNADAQYYANFAYKHNEGWIPDVENATDIINMRGNVDFSISNDLKMRVDAVANFEFSDMPKVPTVNNNGYITDNYWKKLRTTLPNAYPLLWDPGIITDPMLREEVMTNANLMNGMLLGGSNAYQNNLFGQMFRNGQRKEMKRSMELNIGLEYDLGQITEGLRASAYGSMNFYNSNVLSQDATFAIYQPIYGTDINGKDSVGVWTNGEEDVPGQNFKEREKQGYFTRRFGFYGNLHYDRTFGDHNVSAVALLYRDDLKKAYDQNDKNHTKYAQNVVKLHYGVSVNYAYKNRYIADVSAVMVGSRKLAPGQRWGFSPSVGAAWILSEEEFMPQIEALDFLKLRTSFGISRNDDWDYYYLYENLYNIGGTFTYNNGASKNEEINYTSVANSIDFQGRREFTIGFDALMFDKTLRLESGYFRSTAFDNITEMSNTYPKILGYSSLIYQNYNSNLNHGLELGLEYNKRLGDVDLTLGANMVYRAAKVLKKEEPIYADDAQHRSAVDRKGNSRWGYTAAGLYAPEDFDTDGKLLSTLPQPTFGGVQPGDIKYVDINGDNAIDPDDQDIIGNSTAPLQYSAYINLKYKKIEFYTLGSGQVGQDNFMNNAYFWVYGDMKYSDVVLNAYGPDNQNANAAYPRLSTTKNNNNYRNSTFWLYDNDWFTIPAMQLSYNFGSLGTSFLKNAKLYVRATDVVMINKNKDKSRVKIDAAPSTRSVSLGFITTF